MRHFQLCGLLPRKSATEAAVAGAGRKIGRLRIGAEDRFLAVVVISYDKIYLWIHLKAPQPPPIISTIFLNQKAVLTFR